MTDKKNKQHKTPHKAPHETAHEPRKFDSLSPKELAAIDYSLEAFRIAEVKRGNELGDTAKWKTEMIKDILKHPDIIPDLVKTLQIDIKSGVQKAIFGGAELGKLFTPQELANVKKRKIQVRELVQK